MAKERVTFKQCLIHWFTYHPWLKLIALILAIMAWLYVQGEISNFNY